MHIAFTLFLYNTRVTNALHLFETNLLRLFYTVTNLFRRSY